MSRFCLPLVFGRTFNHQGRGFNRSFLQSALGFHHRNQNRHLRHHPHLRAAVAGPTPTHSVRVAAVIGARRSLPAIPTRKLSGAGFFRCSATLRSHGTRRL